MFFGFRQRFITDSMLLWCEMNSDRKYLGMRLTASLSWNVQSERLPKAVTNCIGLLSHIKDILPTRALNLLHKLLLLHYFDDCDTVFTAEPSLLRQDIHHKTQQGGFFLASLGFLPKLFGLILAGKRLMLFEVFPLTQSLIDPSLTL